MKKTILSLLVAVILALVETGGATSLVSSTGSSGLTYFSDTVGYKFTVGSQSLSVTSLGFYKDSNASLYSAPSVGIWTTGGSLLASLTIPLNAFNDGRYLWSNLTSPLTLNASTSYLIGTCVGNYYGAYMVSGVPTLSSDVSLVGSARNGNQYVFSAPTSVTANGTGVVGPNMQYTAIPNPTPASTPIVVPDVAPEPSTYALFCIGAIGMLMVMRRKKTA
jgi:hypothetical protein